MIKSDNQPSCPHCAMADAINKWRNSPGSADFITTNREHFGYTTADVGDAEMKRSGVIRALAAILCSCLDECDAAEQQRQLMQFNSAIELEMATRVIRRQTQPASANANERAN